MPSRGFTLLELVVSVAILGIGLAMAMQIFSGGLNNIHRMDLSHRAMTHAENVMNQILSDEAIRGPLEMTGDLDEDFYYSVVVDHWEEPRERLAVEEEIDPGMYLLSVVVDIHFRDDRRGRLYRTVSLKGVAKETHRTAPMSPMDAIQQLFGAGR